MADDRLWTIGDVADYLRVSRAKTYRLVNADGLPGLKIGGSWRFRPSAVREWVAERERASCGPLRRPVAVVPSSRPLKLID